MNIYLALCLPGDTAVMRNQNNGIARLVQAFNNPHDLSAGRGVKVSGWLVCQNNRRFRSKHTGNVRP